MFKNYLAEIDGVAIFPIVSFLIFFTSFCLVLLVTYTRKRNAYDEIAAIPLAGDEPNVESQTYSRYEDQ